MKINRMVIDISTYNDVKDFAAAKAAGIVGVIHKASEGRTFVDRTYARHREMAKEAGLLWGAYHFANDGDVIQQVNNFIDSAKPEVTTLMALDYEPNGNHTMSLKQARQFMEMAELKLGRKLVLYSGNLIKEQLGSVADMFWAKRRLWLAQYSNNWKCQISWDKPWLWQYSDGENGPGPHTVPGISGAVDCNSYDGTVEQLAKEWAS